MKEIILHTQKNLSFSKRIVKDLPQTVRKRLPAEILVVSVAEKESQRINRQYRNKDKAANVLSFRYSDAYGEILVCPAVIRREARAQGHTFHYQMTWYILHGMIHLAGMHHEQSRAAAEKVHRLEQRILAKIKRSKDQRKGKIEIENEKGKATSFAGASARRAAKNLKSMRPVPRGGTGRIPKLFPFSIFPLKRGSQNHHHRS